MRYLVTSLSCHDIKVFIEFGELESVIVLKSKDSTRYHGIQSPALHEIHLHRFRFRSIRFYQ